MPRSTYYYQLQPESAENLRLLRQLDQLYMKRPFYGSRKMAVELNVNRKRIQRLMRILGIEAHYPKPNLSRPAPGHQIYPYLLRGVEILRPNHVFWSTDITGIPTRSGFLYLVAVMDWFSRFVLSWELSTRWKPGFCLAAFNAAFRFCQLDIWNSDQGSAVHLAEFPCSTRANAGSRSVSGWPGPRTRQRVHRTAVALALRELIYPGDFATGARSVPGAGGVLPLLQSPASAPGAGVSDAGRSVPVQIQKEAVIILIWLCPNPWDLTLLFSRMDGAFRFTGNSTCLTIEMLDRG